MKVLLLFTVIIMLFFLWLFPFIFPFGFYSLPEGQRDAPGAAYIFWYAMIFTLTLCLGQIIYRKGCWFFQK